MSDGLILGFVKEVRYSPPSGSYGESCWLTLTSGLSFLASGAAAKDMPGSGQLIHVRYSESKKGTLMLQAWGWPLLAGKHLNAQLDKVELPMVKEFGNGGQAVDSAVTMRPVW